MSINFVAASSQWLNLGTDINIIRNAAAISSTAWVRFATFPASLNACILGIAFGPPPGTTSTERLSYAIAGGSGGFVTMATRASDVDGSDLLSSASAISQALWQHVAVTADFANKRMSIYINGVLNAAKTMTEATLPATSDTNSKNAAVGAICDGSAQFMDGLLEDVRVYNRMLGPAEIKTIYTSAGRDGIWTGCQLRMTMNALAPGQTVVLEPNLGNVDIAGTPTATPLYNRQAIAPPRPRNPYLRATVLR